MNRQKMKMRGLDIAAPPAATASASRSKTHTGKDQHIMSDEFEVIVPGDNEAAVAFHPEDAKEPSEYLEDDKNEPLEEYDPKRDLSSFKFPPTLNLLKVYNTGDRGVDMKEQNENKDKIINTLRNYGIEITSIKATVGPPSLSTRLFLKQESASQRFEIWKMISR